jgi:hypothetical protein
LGEEEARFFGPHGLPVWRNFWEKPGGKVAWTQTVALLGWSYTISTVRAGRVSFLLDDESCT